MEGSIYNINFLFIKVAINLIVISLLIGYLAYILQNSKKTRLLRYYTAMHILIIIVLASNLFIQIAPEIQVKWIFIIIGFMSKAYFDITFLIFGYYYFKKKYLDKKIVWSISIYLLSSLLIIVLNPYHRLFISGFIGLVPSYGIIYYITMAIGCGIEFLGATYMLLGTIGKAKPSFYRIFIIAMTLFSFIIEFLYTSKVLYSPIDIKPILMFIIFTAIFYGAYRFGLLNTVSVGMLRSLEMFRDAVIVFDEHEEVIYRNNATSLFESDVISQITLECKRIFKEIDWSSRENLIRQLQLSEEAMVLTISIKPVVSLLGRKEGYICVVQDDTSIVAAIKELESKNQDLLDMQESIKALMEDEKRLAVIEQRNILAKEIHDVLGHSLNLTFHILESNKVIIDEEPQRALERLNQAIADIDRGIGEIEIGSLTYEDPARKSFFILKQRLKTMTDRLNEVGVSVEVTAIDDLEECSDNIHQTIFRICQESATNSIKHGRASRVIIAIKKRDKTIILHIVDNGRGSSTFKKGNGLRGMEDRVHRLGGNINFGSFDDNEGFLVHANIPVS